MLVRQPTKRLASSDRFADLIIVLANGAVAEQGTHAQLLDRNGVYASCEQFFSAISMKLTLASSMGSTTDRPDRDSK